MKKLLWACGLSLLATGCAVTPRNTVYQTRTVYEPAYEQRVIVREPPFVVMRREVIQQPTVYVDVAPRRHHPRGYYNRGWHRGRTW